MQLQFFKDWLFSIFHKSNLVYTTAWEDPKPDRIALDLKADDTVLVITSGGCNALDYVLDEPKQIYAVDLNPHQSALLELKLAAIRELDFASFFELFGKGHWMGFPEAYHSRLRRHLSPWSQKYWDSHGKKFFCGRHSFYFRGSTGFNFRLLNFAINRILKLKVPLKNWFDAKTLEEQQQIYQEHLKPRLAKLVKLSTDNSLFGWLRGIPPQQFQHASEHYDCSVGEVHLKWMDELFTRIPASENYFWLVSFYGQYSPSCCPNYLKQENFQRLKAGLVDRISVHTDSIETFLHNCNDSISHFVLLDHMDWFSAHHSDGLAAEWQEIINHAKPNARILFRSLLSHVNYLDAIQVKVNGHLHQLPELLKYERQMAKKLHQQDRCRVYGSFYIADLQIVN